MQKETSIHFLGASAPRGAVRLRPRDKLLSAASPAAFLQATWAHALKAPALKPNSYHSASTQLALSGLFPVYPKNMWRYPEFSQFIRKFYGVIRTISDLFGKGSFPHNPNPNLVKFSQCDEAFAEEIAAPRFQICVILLKLLHSWRTSWGKIRKQ
ncbi:hypothetical protein D1B31_13125 [Neobacillus notoginsengisoli]|uniref:Uncharacterized protein n=1 Tax=Neobacillus notoginsengisoli TaxID=1578198 RepID=A0A417YSH3_9BACI|nr:hypothetical protein D1B31_13125 [Neobacillus notoginsengisoli]